MTAGTTRREEVMDQETMDAIRAQIKKGLEYVGAEEVETPEGTAGDGQGNVIYANLNGEMLVIEVTPA